jgi:hypothetical protein
MTFELTAGAVPMPRRRTLLESHSTQVERCSVVTVAVQSLLACAAVIGLAASEHSAFAAEGGISEGPGIFVLPRPLTAAEAAAASRRAQQQPVLPRLSPVVPAVTKASATASSLQISPQATSGTAPQLTVSFQGVDDSGRLRPADPILAVGPAHVVQTVNSLIRISNKVGGNAVTIDPQFQLFGSFFAANPTARIPFDPWIVYDHFDQRFAIVYLSYLPDFSQSHFLIAVSRSSDPTQGFNTFVQRSDLDNATDTTNWADYEKLGFDGQNYFLTANQFTSARQFAYSKIRVMRKSQFYTVGSTPEFFDFVRVDLAGNLGPAFTIQPCVTYGNPGREYLVAAEFGSGSRLTLYSITGTWPNPTTTAPLLTTEGSTTFTPWLFPAGRSGGIARDSTNPVDVGDNRLLNAVFRNGVVYTAHSMATTEFPTAAGIKGINVATRAVALDQVLGAAGEFWCWPAVTADAQNNVGVVFNRLGPNVFVGANYSFKRASSQQFTNPGVLRDGVAGYEGNRLGDYNGMCLDPTDGSFWMNAMWANGAFNEQGYGTWVGSFRPFTPPQPVDSTIVATFSPATNSLTLTGDAGPNNLTITRQGSRYTLNAGGGTVVRLNNAPSATSPSFVQSGALNIGGNLGDGNDSLVLVSNVVDRLSTNLGPGNDRLVIQLSRVNTSQADGGTGLDTFVSTSSTISSNQNVGFP